MYYKPCDELASNLAAAQLQWGCELDMSLTERLIVYVTRHYGRGEFEGLLERALNLELVLDDTERHAYKHALGLFFSRRAQYAREQEKEMNAIPFSPR